MLSIGDLLDGDTTESEESSAVPVARHVSAAAAAATTPSSAAEAKAPQPFGSVASTRAEESKRRIEKLRVEQQAREDRERSAYQALSSVPGVQTTPAPATSAPPVAPRGGGGAGRARHPDSDSGSSEQSTSSTTRSRDRRRRRGRRGRRGGGGGGRSDDDSDSLEDWGVMVADRGTQTFDGVNADTQTDPHPHVISCRECYKKHFGRDVDAAAAGSGCEHGVSDVTCGLAAGGGPVVHPSLNMYSDPMSQQYLADVLPGLAAPQGGTPSSAHWKLQLSKIRYMFDKTLHTLAPTVNVAQSILEAQEGGLHPPAAAAAMPQPASVSETQQPPAAPTSAVATPAAQAPAAVPAAASSDEVAALRRELSELKAAYVQLKDSGGAPAPAPAPAPTQHPTQQYLQQPQPQPQPQPPYGAPPAAPYPYYGGMAGYPPPYYYGASPHDMHAAPYYAWPPAGAERQDQHQQPPPPPVPPASAVQ